MLLSPEEAPLCLSDFSSCWLAQYSGASNTQNHSLGVAKHCGDLVAARALHIHEAGVGALNKTLQLAFPLFILLRGVQQISCERHVFALEAKK